MKKISVIIPAYNEERMINITADTISKLLNSAKINYEIIFIDDGSKDDTWKEIERVSSVDIKGICFSRNFGKEAAIYAGLSNAKGDMVCIIDADLQQRPEVVLEMLGEMEKDDSLDCVAAYQENRKESKTLSGLKSAFYKVINKITDVDFVNGASDFRLLKRTMVDAIIEMTEYHRFSKGIFSWVGFNTKYIPYTVEERQFGETKWSYGKLFKYAFDGIISFSTFPLKLATGVGLVTAFASIIYLFVVVLQKLIFGIDVPGYATIVVLVLFLGGMQLFCLGILGEYLSKIYVQVKNRPIYILKEHLGKDD
jgi:glycosyltransferase involved in cell wall biosynthesis